MIVLFLSAVLLPACGLFDNTHQWDYLKSEAAPPLQVPEGLQPPPQDRTYDVPDMDLSGAQKDTSELEKLELPPAFDAAQQASLDISEQAESTTAGKTRLNVRKARNTEGYDLLVVEASFDKTWDEVGAAVEAMGFKIEDKSRGEGVYHVYQTINKVMTEEEKFLRPRFDKGIREEYQVHLEDRDEQTRITVRNTSGKIDDSALARHLLTQLQARLSEEKPAAAAKPAEENNQNEGG